MTSNKIFDFAGEEVEKEATERKRIWIKIKEE